LTEANTADVYTMTPDQAGAQLAAMSAGLRTNHDAAVTLGVAPPRPPAPTVPTNAAEASAKLTELMGDAKWGAKLLAGDGATKREFDTLSELVAGSADPHETPSPLIETVNSVDDPLALSKSRYEGLIEPLRDAGLPQSAEAYIRDLDAGRRTDRPTAGDGAACQQMLDRLIGDRGWREKFSAGDIAANDLFNALSRIIAFAAGTDTTVSLQVRQQMERLSVR
jgi:hypothetical protein